MNSEEKKRKFLLSFFMILP